MDQDQAFFIYKDRGMSRQLRGRIAAELVFVADRDTAWSQQEMDAFYEVYKAAVTELSRQAAAAGVPLSFVTTVGQFVYKGQLRPGSEAEIIEICVYPQYLKTQGFTANRDYVAARKQGACADEVAVIFVLERHFRAFAMPGQDREYCCLTQNNDAHAVMHELLHLFGAVDLYFPYRVYGLTMIHFPESVMCSYEGQKVDPLTGYLVGWTDTLAPEVTRFLETVGDYSPRRYREACKLEVCRNQEAKLKRHAAPYGSWAALQDSAKKEDPWAEFLMGLCYLEGIGVERDLAWAEAYFTLSGRAGMTVAAMLHAQLLICRGVETDADRLTLYLLLNYNSGNHIKLHALRAACLLTGCGGIKKPDWASKEAIRCYQEEEKFLPFAKRSLALLEVAERLSSKLTQLQRVVTKMRTDYEKWLQEGEPDLQFLIAQILEEGKYAQKDLAGAFTLYQLSGQSGNYRAAREVVRCYRQGIGTAKNEEKAQQWAQWAEKCRKAHPLDAFCALV